MPTACRYAQQGLCRQILQGFVVTTASTARAEHHVSLRVLLVQALEYIVKASGEINIHIALLLLQVRGIGVCYHRVAVPFEELYLWILVE